MKLISWNCRGLNNANSPTIPFLKWSVASCKVDILFLCETKCSVESLKPIFSPWGFSECSGVDAIDTSGGLFVCWPSSVSVSIIFQDINYVLCMN